LLSNNFFQNFRAHRQDAYGPVVLFGRLKLLPSPFPPLLRTMVDISSNIRFFFLFIIFLPTTLVQPKQKDKFSIFLQNICQPYNDVFPAPHLQRRQVDLVILRKYTALPPHAGLCFLNVGQCFYSISHTVTIK
jgi:hypothetical protein